MRRGAIILAWLAAGHAVLLMLSWAFLNVPESNVAMLTLSATLALVIFILAGWIEAAALIGWTAGVTRATVRRALVTVPAFVLAVALYAAGWIGLARLDAWLFTHAGEIDAWLIARFGWTETAPVHRALLLVTAFLRYVVALSLALAVFSAGVRQGLTATFSRRCIAAGLSRRQIGTIGLVVVLLIALPLRAVDWRPGWVPATTFEPLFVAVKLTTLYLIVHTGWALVLWAAAEPSRRV